MDIAARAHMPFDGQEACSANFAEKALEICSVSMNYSARYSLQLLGKKEPQLKWTKKCAPAHTLNSVHFKFEATHTLKQTRRTEKGDRDHNQGKLLEISNNIPRILFDISRAVQFSACGVAGRKAYFL